MEPAMKDNQLTIGALAEQVATVSAEGVPDHALQKATSLFVDTVGCILAGTTAAGIAELRQTVQFWGGTPRATVLGFGDKTSAPSAALLNSVMGHAHDFDDTHDPALNHGCVTVLPALLATAEAVSRKQDASVSGTFSRQAVSGQEFLAALAVGLEVTNRFGMAFIRHLQAGWLPTTLWGPFGCAAACGRILGLSPELMLNAFGFAYSQIHGNRQALVEGALAKRIQPGFSASAGVQAAFLAATELSAAHDIVQGAMGVPKLYTDGKCDHKYLNGLGSFEELMNISVKPYPSCRCTHPVIDAALKMCTENSFASQDIKEGRILLPPSSMAQVGSPFEIRSNPTVDAQFSAAYTAALTFTKGPPTLEDFRAENVVSGREIRELASRFAASEFEEGSAALVPIEMAVTLKGGQRLSARIETAKGSPATPLSEEEQRAKFRDCLNEACWEYSDVEAGNTLSAVESVRDCKDMVELVEKIETPGSDLDIRH